MTKLEDQFSPCQSPSALLVDSQEEEDIKEGENESLLYPLHSIFRKVKVAFLTVVRTDSLRKVKITSPKFCRVSIECMECSKGIPKILLLLQSHLYARGGLQTEGIFRISAAHSRQKYCRDQVNKGIVPKDVDVHCLAGTITAWFREFPRGILDTLLKPNQVMQAGSEAECDRLVRRLPAVEFALFNWAVNLMADVVQEVHRNKMTAHNIAVVFTPNMTRTEDPLTALENVGQLIKLLETLITKTMKDRVKANFTKSAPASVPRSRSVPCMEETSYSREVINHGVKPKGANVCQVSDGEDAEKKLSLYASLNSNPGVRKKINRMSERNP